METDKEPTASESTKTITALAEALHIAEPFEVISESQKVMEVDEKTNLQQATIFDFYAWLDAKGIERKPKFDDDE